MSQITNSNYDDDDNFIIFFKKTTLEEQIKFNWVGKSQSYITQEK